ncbi:MAG: hypothetical protein AB1394_15450, partial [Bacteroidota bacterium]
MIETYVEKIRQQNPWFFENKKYSMVISNDLDSLATAALLQEYKGWKVSGFYDFDGLYLSDDITNELVGIDIAIDNGLNIDGVIFEKAIDNHVCLISKKDSFNPNVININLIDRITNDGSYYNKYCGSTVLQIWSLLDKPLPRNKTGQAILLAIDGAFHGYFPTRRLDFRERHKYYVSDVLGFNELVEFEEKYTKQDFEKVERVYKTDGRVQLEDGYLNTKELKFNESFRLLELKSLQIKNKFSLVRRFKPERSEITKKIRLEKQEMKY